MSRMTVLFFFCAVLTAAGQARPVGDGDWLNVKEFGAKGDAVTDDTKAIQAAFDKSGKPPYPPVYFPPGGYVISDTITFYAHQELNFPDVRIAQSNPAKDIFRIDPAWQLTVRGITFIGGAIQLNLTNENTDQGMLRIEGCTFMNSAGVAIRTSGAHSTQLSIRGCKFTGCEQALDTVCDMTLLAESWIYTKVGMKDKAVIVNRSGRLRCENIMGVPEPIKTRDGNERWIDNLKGSISCVNFRFSGEGGGIPAVVNWNPNGPLFFEDCGFYCAASGRIKGAIFLEEVPTAVTIRDCYGLTSDVLFGVSERLNLDTYFDAFTNPFVERTRLILDPPFNYGSGLPEQLLPYVVGEDAYSHLGRLAPPEGFSAPKKGLWKRGQFVRNPNTNKRGSMTPEGKWLGYAAPSQDAMKEPYGWLCTESGKPGKWATVQCPVVQDARPSK